MTYTELKQAIQDYATNYEPSFIGHIDQFLVMTEKRIIMEASLPVEQSATTLTLVPGTSTIDTTTITGYIAVDSMAVTVSGAYAYLDNKDEEYMRTAFPDPTVQGKPRLYNVYDNKTLKLAPTPDQAYPLELRYSSYPQSVTAASSGTTWLSTNFEFALLYGSLRDAAVYLKEEPDVVAMYESKYTEAMNEVIKFGEKKASVDSYRTRG
jgi:hypothetical protein